MTLVIFTKHRIPNFANNIHSQMAQRDFDKGYMSDPRKAFFKEYLITNGCGAYSTSSIGGCNMRKYHGLLIAPQSQIDDNDHVIVSAIQEQVTGKQGTYQLGTNKYPNTIYPTGYKHIESFSAGPVPRWEFRFDDCVLVKEMLMPENENAVLIRYTLAEANEKIQLNLFPFLAFRNAHDLKRANLHVNKKIHAAANGIQMRLYPEYSQAFIQTSVKTEFVAAPDWYYGIEYPLEQSRGYAYSEDLFVPGHFSISLKKGDKFVLHVGLSESNPKTLSNRFTAQAKKKPALETEKESLLYAAQQFVIKQSEDVKIKAGYPWFGYWGRDTFISLPGLLLVPGHTKEFTEVIKSSLADLKNGLFPNVGKGVNAVYNSVDASLWFIWAIQQYAILTNNHSSIWPEYGRYLSDILEHYRKGTLYNIIMDSDGLISAGDDGKALTWMDAVVNGEPVTPRRGKAVEINALWYNAVCFCLEAARTGNDTDFVKEWEPYPNRIQESFLSVFSDPEKSYLADYVHNGIADWSVRPNQVFALSIPYSPVPEHLRRSTLDTIKEELLTPKGLRTLSPRDPNYKGVCEGDQATRDHAYHQGTVWPWLLGHYVQAYINEYGQEGTEEMGTIMNDCYSLLDEPCLFTVPEIYNGDYPHHPAGAPAQAWSVAELLRIEYLFTKLKKRRSNLSNGIV